MQVGLREANQQFAKIVKLAKNGEEVILTDRGTPVARIVGIPKKKKDQDWETALNQMAAIGLIRRATDRGPVRLHKPVKIRGKSIVETLREMRDEED